MLLPSTTVSPSKPNSVLAGFRSLWRLRTEPGLARRLPSNCNPAPYFYQFGLRIAKLGMLFCCAIEVSRSSNRIMQRDRWNLQAMSGKGAVRFNFCPGEATVMGCAHETTAYV